MRLLLLLLLSLVTLVSLSLSLCAIAHGAALGAFIGDCVGASEVELLTDDGAVDGGAMDECATGIDDRVIGDGAYVRG